MGYGINPGNTLEACGGKLMFEGQNEELCRDSIWDSRGSATAADALL